MINTDADQTARMRRLMIYVFVVRLWHKIGLLMTWPSNNNKIYLNKLPVCMSIIVAGTCMYANVKGPLRGHVFNELLCIVPTLAYLVVYNLQN